MDERKERGRNGGKGFQREKRIQKHEVEETRRKKDDEFHSQISLRNEYNTKYVQAKLPGSVSRSS